MGATYSDEDGDEQPFIMGCYGVGRHRTLAAVIEQHHDEAGISWPVGVAPLEVAVLPLARPRVTSAEVAERIWSELAAAGIETVIDDRDERAGVKFNDADLIGWPLQLVVGKKGLGRRASSSSRTARTRRAHDAFRWPTPSRTSSASSVAERAHASRTRHGTRRPACRLRASSRAAMLLLPLSAACARILSCK